MSHTSRNAAKTDPTKAESWQFACQDCGTPFRSEVDTCLDCGSQNIAPIEVVA
jgi:rRNA maturation endonuclease Nob1